MFIATVVLGSVCIVANRNSSSPAAHESKRKPASPLPLRGRQVGSSRSIAGDRTAQKTRGSARPAKASRIGAREAREKHMGLLLEQAHGL